MTPNEIFSSNLWFSPFSQLWATVSREGREDLALREHLGVSTLYNASSTRLSRAKLWWNIWPECTVGKLLKALRFTLNTPVPFLMNSKVWSFETFVLLSNFSYLTSETKLSDEIMRWFDSFFVFTMKKNAVQRHHACLVFVHWKSFLCVDCSWTSLFFLISFDFESLNYILPFNF